ncbi:MAG: hypothetical protein KKB59_14200 [Spirochaetes bacterium]|nr:hypothetical protein [Spirochaetota bacterium]
MSVRTVQESIDLLEAHEELGILTEEERDHLDFLRVYTRILDSPKSSEPLEVTEGEYAAIIKRAFRRANGTIGYSEKGYRLMFMGREIKERRIA